MKDIGLKLKEARENSGVSLEEASNDLNIRVSQLENIEEGNLKAFKDVFYLKCFIRDYSKYLGLDEEKIIDEFNEFFFEETSKIPIKEIQKASLDKKKNENKEKKIVSPYTVLEEKKSKLVPIVVTMIILLLLILISYIVITKYVNNKEDETKIITYLEY